MRGASISGNPPDYSCGNTGGYFWVGGKDDPPSLGGFIGPGPAGFFSIAGPVLGVPAVPPHPAAAKIATAVQAHIARRIGIFLPFRLMK
jgi:hypothetical protein